MSCIDAPGAPSCACAVGEPCRDCGAGPFTPTGELRIKQDPAGAALRVVRYYPNASQLEVTDGKDTYFVHAVKR